MFGIKYQLKRKLVMFLNSKTLLWCTELLFQHCGWNFLSTKKSPCTLHVLKTFPYQVIALNLSGYKIMRIRCTHQYINHHIGTLPPNFYFYLDDIWMPPLVTHYLLINSNVFPILMTALLIFVTCYYNGCNLQLGWVFLGPTGFMGSCK